MKTLKRELIKKNKKNIGHFEKIENENKRPKDKLRDLEDQSRRDNLRFDGVREYENESWNETEEVLKIHQGQL